MPKVKGMRLGKLRAQQPATPQQVVMSKKNRERGFGDTVKPVTHYTLLPQFRVFTSNYNMSEEDVAILQDFRREMRACDERACLCKCHCHAGPYDCYKQTLDDEDPKRFHFRKPNTTHKRAHRECPKGDEHKW
jgi:hypothetical protein